MDKQELHDWLSSFPYALRIYKDERRDYRLAHAFFPDDLVVADPVESELEYFYRLSGKAISDCVYGPTDSNNARLAWWTLEEYQNTKFMRIAGHYHVYVEEKSCKVLDNGCGAIEGAELFYQYI
jgi:hypothetical protein